MAYKVTIPGAQGEGQGRSDSIGVSPISEEVVIPVIPVAEEAPQPLPPDLSESPGPETDHPPIGRPIPDLDSRAVCEHFGVSIPDVCTTATATAALARALLAGKVKPQDVTTLHTEVWAAVCAIEWEIGSGTLKRQPRLVRGKPLADWLSLDDLARLLRAGAR